MGYDRKIKYLELMEQGINLQNAGFIKLEIRDAKVSVQIKVDKLNFYDNDSVPIFLVSQGTEAALGEMNLEQGKGSCFLEALDYENLAGDISYENLQEIQIRLQNGRYLRCVINEKSEEHEKVAESYPNEVIEAAEEAEVMQEEEKETILLEEVEEKAVIKPMQQPELGGILLEVQPPKEKEEPALALQMPREEYRESTEEAYKAHRTTRPLASTKWQQLWESYPHITPFDDSREYVKLKPEDLVVLSAQCYSLVSNSFLLHGFYNYKHLILSKELVRGQEQYYVGAPGNFYVKEKQVAIFFGFESFEGKAEPAQNGDFGYYMIPVEI